MRAPRHSSLRYAHETRERFSGQPPAAAPDLGLQDAARFASVHATRLIAGSAAAARHLSIQGKGASAVRAHVCLSGKAGSHAGTCGGGSCVPPRSVSAMQSRSSELRARRAQAGKQRRVRGLSSIQARNDHPGCRSMHCSKADRRGRRPARGVGAAPGYGPTGVAPASQRVAGHEHRPVARARLLLVGEAGRQAWALGHGEGRERVREGHLLLPRQTGWGPLRCGAGRPGRACSGGAACAGHGQLRGRLRAGKARRPQARRASARA
jgi:hypothetical protein